MKKFGNYKTFVIAVIILGIFLRFYRLPDLTSFSYEQALALESSGKMVQTGKISLIGSEYFIRQTSSSHSFFSSGAYLYPLSLVQLIFGYDPIYPAILFTTLNLCAGIGLFFLVDKYFKKPQGLVVLTLFMFSPMMIQASRTVWHVYLLVPIIVFSIWMYQRFLNSINPLELFLLGISLGLGFGIHISYILAIAFFFIACLYRLLKKQKLIYLTPLVVGILIGYFPLVLFDLRHNFYNTSTMLTFLWEMLTTKKSGFSFETYHFIFLMIPIYILLSQALQKFVPTKIIVPLLLLYITLSFPSWHIFDSYAPGMPNGTNLHTMKYISSLIAKDAPMEFSVASIVDGETRAENLRYLLEFVDKKTPLASDKYPEAETLYVVSYLDQDPLSKSVWELDSIKPAKAVNTWQINDLIKITKLERERH